MLRLVSAARETPESQFIVGDVVFLKNTKGLKFSISFGPFKIAEKRSSSGVLSHRVSSARHHIKVVPRLDLEENWVKLSSQLC